MLGLRRISEHEMCDACGTARVRAFARAEWWQPRHVGEYRFDDGEVVELFMCASHFRMHKDALSRIVGVYLIDETEFVLG